MGAEVTPSSAVISRVDPAAFAWAAPSGTAAAVRRVVAEASSADGRVPLNEATLLSLRHSGLSGPTSPISLWTAAENGVVEGFALAALDEEAASLVASLVVAPSSRRRGLGRVLARKVLLSFPGVAVSAWSHGNHPGAAALAPAQGFERARSLWVMRRTMADELPPANPPDATVVRTFDPGRDAESFLQLNAAAFADHPEQGAITRADLEQRMGEPWFDPAGFFLAESATGELLGFHWTKVHPGDPAHGEVYVVGISPEAQGLGLGKALTLTGLHHLRSLGLSEVVLFVESDNAPAVALYQRLGFGHDARDTDVMYSRPAAR